MLHLFFGFRVREDARTPATTAGKRRAGHISRNGRQGWLNPNSTRFFALPQLDPSTQHSGDLHWQINILECELCAALVKIHFSLQVYSKCTLEFENQCLVMKDRGSVIWSVLKLWKMKNEVVHSRLELGFWKTRCPQQALGLRASKWTSTFPTTVENAWTVLYCPMGQESPENYCLLENLQGNFSLKQPAAALKERWCNWLNSYKRK